MLPPLASYRCDQPLSHGAGCECLVLGEACHGGPGAIPFSYCYRVLQKRYRMKCCHGEVGPAVAGRPSPARWLIEGEVDALKAILLKNA